MDLKITIITILSQTEQMGYGRAKTWRAGGRDQVMIRNEDACF